MIELVHYPHPALLKKTKLISPGEYDDLDARIEKMFEIMYQGKGVGLAAPQVGWSASLCVINPTLEKQDEEVLINPRIVGADGREIAEEGCLSFPGIYAKILRAQSVVVDFMNERFEAQKKEFTGFAARVVQHEIDHLENILLIHRMSEADRLVNRRRLKDLKAKVSE
ncbi:MAG: peptide deformylase [Planctomycetes bacterium]|nr:peptide deformylase [Planctomycetota bacterium]